MVEFSIHNLYNSSIDNIRQKLMVQFYMDSYTYSQDSGVNPEILDEDVTEKGGSSGLLLSIFGTKMYKMKTVK